MTAEEQAAERLTCPHCGNALGLEVTTKLMAESRVTLRLEPHPGERLDAKTVGGSIENISELLSAVGDEMGVKTMVIVDGIESHEGNIAVHLIVARNKAEVTT